MLLFACIDQAFGLSPSAQAIFERIKASRQAIRTAASPALQVDLHPELHVDPQGPPRIYLVSFPKSGNTWMRYCIELLTQRPTREHTFKPDVQNQPLGNSLGHALDFSKNPVWKVHSRRELNLGGYQHNPQTDLLIFLIRNPKELMARVLYSKDGARLFNRSWCTRLKDYVDALDLFHHWGSHKKLLIYYEDFINNPEDVMHKVAQFLGDPEDKFDDFFAHYTEHKKRGIKFYEHNGGSQSQGNDLLYHSRKMPSAIRIKIDQFIKTAYTELWETYLVERYSEEALQGKYAESSASSSYHPGERSHAEHFLLSKVDILGR